MPQRFSASVASMHMACHASANLDLAIPGWTLPERDPDEGAAGEGTRVHALLAQAGELNARDIRHLAQILDYVADLRSSRRFKVMIETPVKATWLTTKPGTTADLVLYTQDEIHVIDYKWGKIPVEVVENEQLLFYDVCYAPLAPKAKGVTNHILQPRANNMSSWFADTTRLEKFMSDAMAAEAAIQQGSIAFMPGDHCTFCPANPHSRGDKGSPLCPAMLQMLYPRHIDEDEILSL